MTTMKQRAAARRNIKKAIAANRRGGKKHRKSHRSGRSSAGASHSEGIGSAYLNTARGISLLSPVIDTATSVISARSLAGAGADLKNKAQVATLGNVVITMADAAIDKRTGQAAALSRGSISAWAPEI